MEIRLRVNNFQNLLNEWVTQNPLNNAKTATMTCQGFYDIQSPLRDNKPYPGGLGFNWTQSPPNFWARGWAHVMSREGDLDSGGEAEEEVGGHSSKCPIIKVPCTSPSSFKSPHSSGLCASEWEGPPFSQLNQKAVDMALGPQAPEQTRKKYLVAYTLPAGAGVSEVKP